MHDYNLILNERGFHLQPTIGKNQWVVWQIERVNNQQFCKVFTAKNIDEAFNLAEFIIGEFENT